MGMVLARGADGSASVTELALPGPLAGSTGPDACSPEPSSARRPLSGSPALAAPPRSLAKRAGIRGRHMDPQAPLARLSTFAFLREGSYTGFNDAAPAGRVLAPFVDRVRRVRSR